MSDKRMSAIDWNSVTFAQIEDMKHAIGFSSDRVVGSKNRRYQPYRNYFCTYNGSESWEKLVAIGLAEKWTACDLIYYGVTKEGKLFLCKVTGVVILEDMR